MSWLDLHADHSACGRTLDALAHELDLEARFFISPLYQPGALCRKMKLLPAPVPVGGWIEDRAGRVASAAAAYDVWDPAAGRYAIGARYSVPDQFAHLRHSPRSRWHRDSSCLADPADGAAASAWLERFAPQPAVI